MKAIKYYRDINKFENSCENLIYENKYRTAFLLPSLELDSVKHSFGHEHNMKLFFGFFDSTR